MKTLKVLDKKMSKKLKLTNSSTLQKQWDRFIKSNYSYHRFTKDLYNAMYTKGGFIAHYNKEGFYKARFCTLSDLDHTMTLMNSIPELYTLLDNTHTEHLINSRNNVIDVEYRSLIRERELIDERMNTLDLMKAI